MKKTFTILMLSTILCLLPGQNGAMAQLFFDDFVGNTNNPVITNGGPGSYDEMIVTPFALWDDETYYLFYTGAGTSGGLCLATSPDGYTYSKFAGNPVLMASGIGFDSLIVGGTPVVLKIDSEWVMYYNARQFPGWGPGESTGRATADSLTGTWERSSDPVLTIGSPGEWDQGLINTNSVLPLDTGGFIMFYYASDVFSGIWLLGMATSLDGITWTKYNNPSTTVHPYAESDPVLPVGNSGEFDEWGILGAGVLKKGGYFHMFYSGIGSGPGGYRTDIGYAYSADGITWEKWPENPIYVQEDDPYFDPVTMIFEQPCVMLKDTKVYMFYDYGVTENSIGLAASDVIDGISNRKITNYGLRITNYPNPVTQSTTFSYKLNEPGQIKLELFDSFGRLEDVLVNTYKQNGEYQITWNAEAYPAGIHFYRLQADGKTCGGKMIVVK